MHWYREGSRQRSRILYVFRTPGGVRVGRDPLEPDVLRDIEAQYPDIEFDWKAVLDNQQVVESRAGVAAAAKARDGREEGRRRPSPARRPSRRHEPERSRRRAAASAHSGGLRGRHAGRADRVSAPLVSDRARAHSAADVRSGAARGAAGARRAAESGGVDRCGSDCRRAAAGGRSARAAVARALERRRRKRRTSQAVF